MSSGDSQLVRDDWVICDDPDGGLNKSLQSQKPLCGFCVFIPLAALDQTSKMQRKISLRQGFCRSDDWINFELF